MVVRYRILIVNIQPHYSTVAPLHRECISDVVVDHSLWQTSNHNWYNCMGVGVGVCVS